MAVAGGILVQYIVSHGDQDYSVPGSVWASPRYLGITPSSVPVRDLREWLQERQLMTALLRQHLHCANNRMKHFADGKRTNRVFQVGDWVYLRLQPYIQTSLAMRANAKLAFRYFGPFQIEQRIGDRSYRLQLPPKSKLHPVFQYLSFELEHRRPQSIKNFRRSMMLHLIIRYRRRCCRPCRYIVATRLWSRR